MSEILVDTSVWIDYFRKRHSSYADLLDQLLEQQSICTANLIKAEIIPGAKSKKEYRMLNDYFSAIPLAEDPPDLWENITEYQFGLKRKGIHGISIPDLIIISVAIHNGKIILTKDKHFTLAKKLLPFKLIQEPF